MKDVNQNEWDGQMQEHTIKLNLLIKYEHKKSSENSSISKEDFICLLNEEKIKQNYKSTKKKKRELKTWHQTWS